MKGWKKVDVSLPDPGSEVNHYDEAPKRKGLKAKDLEAKPAEAMGMFFGLEVLDGSMYEVRNNALIFKKDEEKTEEVKKEVKDTKKAIEPVSNKKKKQRTKQAKRDEGESDGEGEPVTRPAHLEEEAKEGNDEKHTKKRRKDGKTPEKAQEEKLVVEEQLSSDEPVNKKLRAKEKKRRKRLEKKKKRKAASSQQLSSETAASEASSQEVNNETTTSEDVDAISRIQSSWMIATGGVTIKEAICKSLLEQGFERPTPIQAATLPASVLGRRNIVGAAPTGSGKTLAYALPILQHMLEKPNESRALQALILAPTRELALQVAKECEKLMPKSTGTIVGGLAIHKQSRVLEKQKPPIVIGTPGRLWELISSRQHDHLNDLSQLRFLVIDEADRMIQQGSFPQLERILDEVHEANPLDEDDESDIEEDDDDLPDRMLALPGIPGEARVEMLGDILQRVQAQQGELPPPDMAMLDDDDDEEELEQLDEDIVDDEDEIELPAAPPVYRQTFVFSATLTLPPSEHYVKKRRGKRKRGDASLTGAIAEILEKAHSFGKTKVVDLTSSSKLVASENGVVVEKREASNAMVSRLPPGLTLYSIPCTQRHKDSHLYAYLVTTAQGASGPCLVFCNSIAAVKRVGTTLLTLKLPVRMLHANMPQKARFKAVESLRSGTTRAIVVSTDVAARGLDIPNVSTVIHYDVARAVDNFIHRAGRTARGMGEKAVGSSVSLVASAEDRQQKDIMDALGKKLFRPVPLDGRLLSEAQERVNLASKIVSCDELESRTDSRNKWFQDAAAEADLVLDDNMLVEGLAGGDLRDQQRLREAKSARGRLRDMLSQPMVTQRFGKFLSNNSAAAAPDVAAHFVPLDANPKKRKKRKQR